MTHTFHTASGSGMQEEVYARERGQRILKHAVKEKQKQKRNLAKKDEYVVFGKL